MMPAGKVIRTWNTGEEVMADYLSYMPQDTSNWRHGVSLLQALSFFYGEKLDPKLYEDCIRKVARIKPLFRGNEEAMMGKNFALPLSRVRRIVSEVTKDTVGSFSGRMDYVLPTEFSKSKYEISKIANLQDLRAQVHKLLGKRAGMFAGLEKRRILTFGSCFAHNMGITLRDIGASVYIMQMTEDINSPFNNLMFLNRVFFGETSQFSDVFLSETGVSYEAIRREFEGATDIIFTLGNIFHLVDDKGGTVLRRGERLVADTPAETADALRKIFAILAAQTRARVYVSVSPVPISGYKGDEFTTAIEADSASKCQLLTALRSVMTPQITYVPTFEIFKWLPPHQSFATFGVDDNDSRHIAREQIRLVMEALTKPLTT